MNNEIPLILRSFIVVFHPALMLCALVGTSYALYSGIQVRRMHNADAEVKRQLAKAKYNQKHYQIGAILLVAWVVGSVIGMVATYVLYSQLFIGSHLIVGLSFICFTSLTVASVPYMQQGKKWARTSHIVFVILLIGLTLWQLTTGFVILQEILGELFNPA